MTSRRNLFKTLIAAPLSATVGKEASIAVGESHAKTVIPPSVPGCTIWKLTHGESGTILKAQQITEKEYIDRERERLRVAREFSRLASTRNTF